MRAFLCNPVGATLSVATESLADLTAPAGFTVNWLSTFVVSGFPPKVWALDVAGTAANRAAAMPSREMSWMFMMVSWSESIGA
jgi:hypothetical protein